MASSDSNGSEHSEEPPQLLVMANQTPNLAEQYEVVCAIVRHLPISSLKNAAKVSKLWASVVSRERLKSVLDVFMWYNSDSNESFHNYVMAKPELLICFLTDSEDAGDLLWMMPMHCVTVSCTGNGVIAYTPRGRIEIRSGLEECPCGCTKTIFGNDDDYDRDQLKGIMIFSDRRLEDDLLDYLMKKATGREDGPQHVALAGDTIISATIIGRGLSRRRAEAGATASNASAEGESSDSEKPSLLDCIELYDCFTTGLLFGGSKLEVTTAMFPRTFAPDNSAMIEELKEIRKRLPPRSSHETVAFFFSSIRAIGTKGRIKDFQDVFPQMPFLGLEGEGQGPICSVYPRPTTTTNTSGDPVGLRKYYSGTLTIVIMFISFPRCQIHCLDEMASSDSGMSVNEEEEEEERPEVNVGEQYEVVCTIIRYLPIGSLRNAARVSKLWASAVARLRSHSTSDIFMWSDNSEEGSGALNSFVQSVQNQVMAKPEFCLLFLSVPLSHSLSPEEEEMGDNQVKQLVPLLPRSCSVMACTVTDVMIYNPRRDEQDPIPWLFDRYYRDTSFQTGVNGVGLSLSLSNSRDAWVKPFVFKRRDASHAQRMEMRMRNYWGGKLPAFNSTTGRPCSCVDKVFGDSDRFNREKLKGMLLLTPDHLSDTVIAYLLRKAAGRDDATQHVALAGAVVNVIYTQDPKPSETGETEDHSGCFQEDFDNNEEGENVEDDSPVRKLHDSYISGLLFGGSGVEVATALFPQDMKKKDAMIRELQRVGHHLPPRSSHRTLAFAITCCGRGRPKCTLPGPLVNHDSEIGYFSEIFPEIPVFGLKAGGEICSIYPPLVPTSSESSGESRPKKTRRDAQLSFGYTTVFMFVSFRRPNAR
ncbi:unnamed protein product [Cyprideis torosa]|uniref:Uncharacterized protein n=1 Tax=Cyprideis torosa TaxID=163714 RepID=A0A7R8ZL44_9CRUS|nr:unnamed protein product [Cyprideis torosa]CAG0892509.1 unnamed protein product [Cyprideis torosa]